jgi:uncharacterized protein with FMN-binding domain
MRRISLWLLSTISVLVLLFGYHTSTSGADPSTTSTSVYSSSRPGSSAGPSTAAASGSTPTRAKTVTGSVAQTRWGPVQVQLRVKGGTITKVSVIQYPNGNGKDAEINSRALPALTQETVDAQSAGIDMVSGATVTSDGYLESLQSAIDKAGL